MFCPTELAKWVRHGAAPWIAAVALLLTSCGGGSGDGKSGGAPAANPAGFELRLGVASVAAPQGSSGRLRVRIERQPGFSGPIEVGIANPPAGISADTVVVDGDDEAQLPLRIAAEMATGAVGLVISGSGGGATTTIPLQLDVQAAQPRSPQLIQAALDAGQIDLGTSLLYRAYAVFGDAKLPAAFVGSGPAEEDTALFGDVEQARPTLPQAILEQLQPYLLRPDDPESAFNKGRPTGRERRAAAIPDSETCSGTAREWITARSTLHPVRAWALCLGTAGGNATARNNLFRVLDVVDKAYGKMVELMGPAKADLYGDEAIDIYVVPPAADVPRASGDYAIEGVRGVAPAQPPFVGRTSSGYVMLPTWRLAERDYQLTVIHELFHVLQFAHNYRLADYWFTEASATWASFHFNRTAPVRPADNAALHRERFGGFQASGDGLLSVAGQHEYFAYIWPFFMEQETSATRIGSAWDRFGDVSTQQAATAELDALLPFKDNLRRFAVRNIDQQLLPGDPVATRYKKLDGVFPEAEFRPRYTDYPLDGTQVITHQLDIPGLAARYLRFLVGEASGVQSVEFDFGNLSGRDHLSIDALIDNGNAWVASPVPLDNEPRPRFCFDLGPATATVRGAFFELRLVLANHALDAASTVAGALRVRPSRGGCAGWSGEIGWSLLSDIPGVGRTDASTLTSVTFEVDENPPGGSTPGVVQYKVRSGRVSYRAEQTFPTCRQVASGDVEMSPVARSGNGATVASLTTFSSSGVLQYGSNTGATFGDIIVIGNCTPDGSEQTITHRDSLIPWWNLPSTYTLKEDGTLMEEDITTPGPQGGTRNQWKLRKLGK